MSIEKAEFTQLINEKIPFSTIPNYVLQTLKDGLAIGIWAHLVSLPHDWQVNRQYLMNHFEIGRDKLDAVLKYLVEKELIEYVWTRCANGTVHSVQIKVHDGVNLYLKHRHNTSTLKNHSVVQPLSGKTAPTKEIINTKEIKDKNKSKRYCASDDARDTTFDQFWQAYPVKKGKKRAKTSWLRQSLAKKAEAILKDIENRKANDPQWADPQYIPHPSTYLNGERWEDEITKPQQKVQNKPNEIHSTVPFFEKKEERILNRTPMPSNLREIMTGIKRSLTEGYASMGKKIVEPGACIAV